MDAKHKGILDERIKETKEKILIEEGQKLKDELNELIKVCVCQGWTIFFSIFWCAGNFSIIFNHLQYKKF